MTPTLLDRPAPNRVTNPQPAARGPARPRPRDPRWILPAAITISVLVHLVAFLAFRFSVTVYPVRPAEVRAQRMLSIEPAMHVVQVLPVTPPELAPAPAPVAETPRPEPVPEPPQVTTPVTILPPVTTADPERTGRDPEERLYDRIRPRADARLMIPPPPPEDNLTETERALLPLYGTLASMNDSARAAALAALKATDWTTTDANGNRWGISPGQIHLGKITLPLPFGFSTPPGRRDEIAGRVRGWGEIQRQAGETEVRETFEERVKAIRERNRQKRDTTATTGTTGKK